MKVTFLDCKSKDSILVQVEDSNYLINCNSKTIDQLEKLNISNVDGIFVTKMSQEIFDSIGDVTITNCQKKTTVLLNKRNIRDIPKKFNYENKYKVYKFQPGCMFSFPNLKVTPIEMDSPMRTENTHTGYLFSPSYSKKETVICADMLDNYNDNVKPFFNNVERFVFLDNDEFKNADNIINMFEEYKPKEIIFYTQTEKNFSQENNGVNIKITSEPISFGEIKGFKDVILGYKEQKNGKEEYTFSEQQS